MILVQVYISDNETKDNVLNILESIPHAKEEDFGRMIQFEVREYLHAEQISKGLESICKTGVGIRYSKIIAET